MKQKNNKRRVFIRHKPVKISDKKTAARQNRQAAAYHVIFAGPVYSLEGCSPAEPSSASTGITKFIHANQHNKLIYQHVN